MSEIIRIEKDQEPQVVGLSPEMTRKLTRLQNQIRRLLDHPLPMKSSGPKEPWSDLSDRYDIIIGDFGIKDLSVKGHKELPSTE